jgi:hypothetical protein
VRLLRTVYATADERTFQGHTRDDIGSATASSDAGFGDAGSESNDEDECDDEIASDDGDDRGSRKDLDRVARTPLNNQFLHGHGAVYQAVESVLEALISGAFSTDSGFSQHDQIALVSSFGKLDAAVEAKLPGQAAKIGATLGGLMDSLLQLLRRCFADPHLRRGKGGDLQNHHDAQMFFHGMNRQPGGRPTLIVRKDGVRRESSARPSLTDLPALPALAEGQWFDSRCATDGQADLGVRVRGRASNGQRIRRRRGAAEFSDPARGVCSQGDGRAPPRDADARRG